jgi:Xaa-Pro aminopeptidase
VADALRERGIHDARIGGTDSTRTGFLALQTAGPRLEPVQPAIEQARATKGVAETELMRRSVRVCDAVITHLHQALRHRTTSTCPASDGLPEPLTPLETACSTRLVDMPIHSVVTTGSAGD